jgi:hypothetical protein
MQAPKCADCRYWEPVALGRETGTQLGIVAVDRESGRCRRRAPVLVCQVASVHGMSDEDAALLERLSTWPRTWGTDWCGDFVRGSY